MKKVILITGASAGMGKTTARKLINEGHIVYGLARRIEKMQDLVELGGHAIKMDVTDDAEIISGLNAVMDAQGKIDVLINNAGYSVYGSVEEVSLEDARKQFEVNLFGLASLTKKVIPIMRERQAGQIINVTSVAGKIGWPLGSWYHASKHALEGWSDSLRLEVKRMGIDVTIIEPGAIASEFYDVMNEPLLERSKGGPYENIANSIIQANEKNHDGSTSTSPDVIAQIIVQAIECKRPKIRYSGGKGAKAILFLRWLLNDSLFDRLILGLLK